MAQPLSFRRHRVAQDLIRQAVWWYFRFTLSIRDVEALMAQPGMVVNREAIRCWVVGQPIAANIRRRRASARGRRRCGKMVRNINGRRKWLWRAVDDEGKVLDVLERKRRNVAD